MSIEIVLEGQLEKETDKEAFSAFLKQVCDEKKLKLEDYDATVMIDICPEGYIECGYEDRFVSIAAQTNVAGPGFHAFVCTVFDEIISGSQIPLEVNDPTGYYTDRNFENLKYKYFYRWLKAMFWIISMRKRNYASPGRRSIITLSTERALSSHRWVIFTEMIFRQGMSRTWQMISLYGMIESVLHAIIATAPWCCCGRSVTLHTAL